VSVIVTDKSAEATVVLAVALSLPGLGSVVEDVTVAVFEITVPPATDALTLTTSGKVRLLPAVKVVIVQLMVPVPPTAGIIQVQPAGGVNEEKVVPEGNVSCMLTLLAFPGPLLVSVMV
jgi:hypothetical protein